MTEHPRTEPDPEVTPQIDTPVIHIQDVEHTPLPQTRVSNAGMKVRPRKEPHIPDDLSATEFPEGGEDDRALPEDPMFAREDEEAREAVAKFEESLKSLPPD